MSRTEIKPILMESPLYEGKQDTKDVIKRNGLKLESVIDRFFDKYLNKVTAAIVISAAIHLGIHIIAYFMRR